jgi:hypothetical protein
MFLLNLCQVCLLLSTHLRIKCPSGRAKCLYSDLHDHRALFSFQWYYILYCIPYYNHNTVWQNNGAIIEKELNTFHKIEDLWERVVISFYLISFVNYYRFLEFGKNNTQSSMHILLSVLQLLILIPMYNKNPKIWQWYNPWSLYKITLILPVLTVNTLMCACIHVSTYV